MVEKIVLDDRREYVYSSKDLQGSVTEIHPTVLYTLQESKRAEWMKRTVNNGIWTC